MSTLRDKLIEFRDLQAQREGLEVYKVLQYPTIDEIVKVWPTTLDQLGKIKGIGPSKLKKYGQAILDLVASVANPENHLKDESHNASEVQLAQGDLMKNDDKQVISVAEYLDYLNLVFQKTADVKIQGEVSAPKEYPSGMYFTLKDKTGEGVLNCFIPLYTYRGLGLPLEEGMEVRVEGLPRMVKRNGRFQFTIENLELAGEGALKKAYDLLKAKLEAEGLFARKRDLPEFISSVGIITSRAGAVIHDFRNNLEALGIELLLKDVRVEGSQAPRMIIDAIKYFNKPTTKPVDVLVILRGGGSLEDLKAFNDEQVARTVFSSAIPTIIAIGHDKDVPLAQLAADLMVSTPTAASHAVNNSWSRLRNELPVLSQGLLYNYERSLDSVRTTLSSYSGSLMYRLQGILERYKRISLVVTTAIDRYVTWVDKQSGLLDQLLAQMTARVEFRITHMRNNILAAETFLDNVNPERNLKLGYSIVRSSEGKIVRSVHNIASDATLYTQLGDGSFESKVTRKGDKSL